MAFSVGEDLFSVLTITGIVIIFVVVLCHSYHVYMERRNASQDFNLALDIAERLVNQVLAADGGQPGVIKPSSDRLENYSKILALHGTNLRVEIRSFSGELLFAHGIKPDLFKEYFSPPVSVSLPVALFWDQSSALPCELSVQVWRG
ncbi:MAG TPA: hypothetical protein ENF64_02240 [Hadesarchaea archaeon]|nr:hypothetical protein [Hadesarchaea archaeon]